MSSKPDRRASIRRLLFLWLLPPLVALLLLSALVGYPVALYPATAAYDWALMDTAHSLSRLIVSRAGVAPLVPPAAETVLRTDLHDRIYFAVHTRDGRLVAGDKELAAPAPQAAAQSEFFYDGAVGGEPVRVAGLLIKQAGGDAIVQVAETTAKRDRLAQQILIGIVSIEALLIAMTVILVWLGIAKGLEPLQRLREEIDARSPRDLRPVAEERAPTEAHSVVRALNRLLQQLQDMLDSQQRFVANAAHQLRTPLAGIRMQVEHGLRQENPAEWRRALQALVQPTERAVRLIHQLLILANAEAGAVRREPMREIALRALVETVAGEWMPRAIAKNIDFGLELNCASVMGDPLLMQELLSNLIDNAINYTPAGGSVTVRCGVKDGRARLEVEDDGPGVPQEEREKVFRRFFRGSQSSGEGCGLGLAIVREIAYIHHAQAALATPQGKRGTLFTVTFS